MSDSRRITRESKVRRAIVRAAPARREPTPIAEREPSLNEVLASLGYTTAPGSGIPHPGKKILRDGEVVHEGSADSTWTWLRQTGQIA